MSIVLREHVGFKANKRNQVFESPKSKSGIDITESLAVKIKPGTLMQRIEGIHVGPTGNFNWYTEEALESCLPTWTVPYGKPLIMNHDEENGQAIGRIVDAENVRNNTRSGTMATVFLCNVSDKEGIEKIEDGRLCTVSVGVTATEARCSICGCDLEIGEDGHSLCGHIKGNVYDGETCFWNIYEMRGKELSYVNVPSDMYAHNLDSWYVKEPKDILSMAESLKTSKGDINLSKAAKSVTEGIDNKEGLNFNETGVQDTGAAREDNNNNESEEDEEGGIENGVQNKEESNEEDNKEEEIKCESCEALKDENEKLKKEIEDLKKDAFDAKRLLVLAQEKIDKVCEENKQKDSQLEAAENEAVIAKSELRNFVENSISTLSEISEGEKVEKEALAVETTESLKSTFVSLQEKLINAKKAKVEPKVEKTIDPTLKRENQFKEKLEDNSKKEEKRSNVSLEEALKALYSK